FLLNDPLDVLGEASVTESRQDTGRFGDKFLRVVLPVDANWVDLEQHVDHLVVQRAIPSLKTLARRTALFVFAHGEQSLIAALIHHSTQFASNTRLCSRSKRALMWNHAVNPQLACG